MSAECFYKLVEQQYLKVITMVNKQEPAGLFWMIAVRISILLSYWDTG